MQENRAKLYQRFAAVMILTMALLGSLLWNWQDVRADDERTVNGIVQTMPGSGVIGRWSISDHAYRTTADSEIQTEKGPLVVGACVEVEYSGRNEPYVVRKLETKNSDDCSNLATATPDGTDPPAPDETATPQPTDDDDGDDDGDDDDGDDDDGDDDDGDDDGDDDDGDDGDDNGNDDDGDQDEAKGLIEIMPESDLIGAWRIAGVDYESNDDTRIRQKEGPLTVGACVEIEFDSSTTPPTLTRIETEEMNDCTDDDQGTPTVTPTPGTSTLPPATFFDRINSIPDGLIGEWVFEGVTYLATTETRFQAKRGPFEVGACAKVTPFNEPAPRRIRTLETTHEFLCAQRDDGKSESELFGILQQFPADLLGEWQIGGKTFVADENTEFNQKDGAFALDVTVKVHFTTDETGVNYASEIETIFQNDDDGDDDDGNGVHEGANGHAFGVIDSFPENLIGNWTISGVDYTARIETAFVQSNASFAEGVRVKVKYFLDADGNRVAQQIKATNETGAPREANHFKLYGFVDQMPPDGFVGQWIVGNIAFMADDASLFEEDDGLLAIGSFIDVEYYFKEGRNQIYKIESLIPPGGGDRTHVGPIEQTDDDMTAANMMAGTWVIGDQNYLVTPATDLNEVNGALVVGATVVVNSYTAPDGSQVATQIVSVVLNNQVLLPLVSR